MEHLGAFLDEEWDSLKRMFSGDHFRGNELFLNESLSSPFCSEESSFYCSDVNFNCFFQENNDLDHVKDAACNDNVYYDQSMDLSSLGQVFADDFVEEMKNSEASLAQPIDIAQEMQLQRGFENVNMAAEEENPKKKSRITKGDEQKQKKKKQKHDSNCGNNEEETTNKGGANNNSNNGQSSSNSDSSEDDDSNGGIVSDSKPNVGKKRATRGSATDPQSLYARKRRERINERLRILQNLVPNGTKVDISTMLEEAVHYVKFLQLQIKLLSSDDMWMYAPIAYNGMDMGLYQRIAPTL